jgi:hypothetical protein
MTSIRRLASSAALSPGLPLGNRFGGVPSIRAGSLLVSLVLAGSVSGLTLADPLFPNPVFEAGSDPTSVAVGDFNGDGQPDLVVANQASNDVSVLLGNGDGTFGAQARFASGVGPDSVAVGWGHRWRGR